MNVKIGEEFHSGIMQIDKLCRVIDWVKLLLLSIPGKSKIPIENIRIWRSNVNKQSLKRTLEELK